MSVGVYLVRVTYICNNIISNNIMQTNLKEVEANNISNKDLQTYANLLIK